MKTTIVSDTSSLIIFAQLQRVNLLSNVFNKIIVPARVYSEIGQKEDDVLKIIDSSALFYIQSSADDHLLEMLSGILDYGEVEAIALAKESGHILLIDEKKGRRIAIAMHLKIIGFLGVLLLNYKQNRLTKEEAHSILNEAKQLQFRLSRKLENHFVSLL